MLLARAVVTTRVSRCRRTVTPTPGLHRPSASRHVMGRGSSKTSRTSEAIVGSAVTRGVQTASPSRGTLTVRLSS